MIGLPMKTLPWEWVVLWPVTATPTTSRTTMITVETTISATTITTITVTPLAFAATTVR